MLFQRKKNRIYLDYAAATPVRSEVLAVMRPYFSDVFANAGAIHKEGVAAKNAIDQARASLARVLHVRPQGVVFTASGTESNNIAIFGTLRARHEEGIPYKDMEVVSTEIEHPSILQVLKEVQSWGVHVVYAPTNDDGLIALHDFESCLSPKTVLVSLAYANSEIGVIQPIGKITRVVQEAQKKYGSKIVVHVDGAQAPLWLSCELDKLGADILTLDAGKCYGPKGVGVIAYTHGTRLAPFILGGTQEAGLRAGTENTALIVGAATALCMAQETYTERSERALQLREECIELLLQIEGAILNGSRTQRLANNINISIPGMDSEFAVITLDEHGIACATKSACGGAKGDGSHVVRAITKDEKRALSTLRFTLGEKTTREELIKTATVLRDHVQKMRTFSAS